MKGTEIYPKEQSHGWSIIIHSLCLLLLWLHVRLNKEVSEKEEERQDVDNVRCRDTEIKSIASIDDEVRSLRHHCDELSQLHQGKVGFPPDRERFSCFRDLCVHADEVVCVHDSVDESVEDNGQVNITIIKNVCVEPVEQKDGGVMVDVKEGKLSPLFTQDNKDGVPKVPNLGNVKQPQKIGNGRIVLAVGNARGDGVSIAVRQENGFDRHVRTKHDLRDIVKELDWVRVDGRLVLHDLGSNRDKQNVGESNGERRRKICQPPSLGVTTELAFRVKP
mmetsp:Transcript_26485/g.56757  ORF Transcript_26485/g.56757 Transcript_26485/m.56757 type:complete len:277 (-) Transcript_26485:119-949(-)